MGKVVIALVCSWALSGAFQAPEKPIKVIEDGVVDRIELFVEKLPDSHKRISVRPFESDGANLGTGGKDGEPEEQDESRLMQKEGPALLAKALAAEIRAKGTFKTVDGEAPTIS